GLTIVLAGEVDITQPDQSGRRHTRIVTYSPGAFMGELAQLAGRPALSDAHARGSVEALIIPPDKLRALLIAEAELGERIMRALILRRVNLIDQGIGGPVLIGPESSRDVIRLQGFLARNGYPYHLLNPRSDHGATALIERTHLTEKDFPVVICPD